MDDQILSKLAAAEDTLTGLKKMLASKQVKKGRDETEIDELHRRYMSYSAVKLIETRGSEVFSIADSVGLYFIVPGNKVRTAARSSILRVVRLSEEDRDPVRPPAFIQVGEWIYPLMEGSMIYRSEHKYYLFPDLVSTTPGSSVGVVLPKSCPQSERDRFEQLILELVGQQNFPPQPPESFGKSTELILSARTSISLIRTRSGVYSQRSSQMPNQNNSGGQGYGKRIGAGFKAGGELISRGIELGAKGTANAMTLGTTCLKSTILKEENERDIPILVSEGAASARRMTGKVLDISSSILTTLANITGNLGALTACYIKASAAPVIQKAIDSSGISQSTIDEVVTELKDAGEGIMMGGLEVYAGMDSASKVLANALTNNTVEIVAHCYGAPAAGVLHCAGEVVGNVALAGMHAGQVMSPENIVRRTTRETGYSIALDRCE